jgi:putative phosphoribosyl transferase
MSEIIFKNRDDAASKLIDVLPIDIMKQEEWIVLSASCGGMSLANDLAIKLNSPIDLIITEKIFTPNNNNCEVAIISETNELVIHEELQKSFDIDLDYIFNSATNLFNTSIEDKIVNLRDGKKLIDIKNENVLIVDEGLNTGLTMMACIKTVLNQGVKSVCVAVPILPKSIVLDLESIADDLYFNNAIDHFVSIDFYYEELEPVSLDDTKEYIKN